MQIFFTAILPSLFMLLLVAFYISSMGRARFTIVSGTMLAMYSFFLLLFVSGCFLAKYGIYYRGYRSSSIIFIAMSFSGFAFWLLYQKQNDASSISTMLFLKNLTCVFLAALLLWEVADEYKAQLFYTDTKYRLEDNRRGINEPGSFPDLYVKDGIFERIIRLDSGYPCLLKKEIDAITVQELSRDSISVTVHHHSDPSRNLANPLLLHVSKK
jgi:hypothetical protein